MITFLRPVYRLAMRMAASLASFPEHGKRKPLMSPGNIWDISAESRPRVSYMPTPL